MPEKRTDEDIAKDCLETLEHLRRIRQPYEEVIDDILTYVYHSRRTVRNKHRQKGKKTGHDMYDSTGLHALGLLADGLAGYSISRAFRWFEYTLPGRFNFPRTSGMRAWAGKRMDEYPDVREWLEACEEVMYAAFLRSNLYDQAPEIIRDAASIGTVTTIAEEDMMAGRIIFSLPHFREVFIAESAAGEVDTVFREYKLSLKQLVEKFGRDTMQDAIEGFDQTWERNRFEEMEIVHGIYPRTDYEPDKANARNKPFASVWVLKGKKKLLNESGYDENPAITWRWRKNNDEYYGRSPAWHALIEIMRANQMGRTNLIAGHKMAEPPMVGPADLRGMVRSGPKGWTWIPGQVTRDRIPLPLQENIQMPFALDQQDRVDQKIREHYHVDFFLMLSQAAMENRNLTATQVIEMAGEKAAVLGPRIGRMETEALNPIHDRAFAIERRAGRIPEPPQILLDYAGRDLEIDYMGPLSQAQKRLFKSQGIRAGLEAILPLAQIAPESIDAIDPDETARLLLESNGFPSKALRDKESIQELREMRQQQMMADKAVEQGTELAKAAPSLGKQIEEGSPMALLAEGTNL
jgi:hypothetical protein